MVARMPALTLAVLSLGLVAAQVIDVPQVPDTLEDSVRADLQITRACLVWRQETHNRDVADFRANCTKLSAACDQKFKELQATGADYEAQTNRLRARIEAAKTAPQMATGPQTVDARVTKVGVEALLQVGQLACSPATNFIRRGYEAIAKHDWQLALPLWQSALLQDKSNDALLRTVDLAQWMVDYQKQGGTAKTVQAARKDPARVPNPARFAPLDKLLLNKWLDQVTTYVENWLDQHR